MQLSTLALVPHVTQSESVALPLWWWHGPVYFAVILKHLFNRHTISECFAFHNNTSNSVLGVRVHVTVRPHNALNMCFASASPATLRPVDCDPTWATMRWIRFGTEMETPSAKASRGWHCSVTSYVYLGVHCRLLTCCHVASLSRCDAEARQLPALVPSSAGDHSTIALVSVSSTHPSDSTIIITHVSYDTSQHLWWMSIAFTVICVGMAAHDSCQGMSGVGEKVSLPTSSARA